MFWPVCASGVGAPDPHTPAAHPLISFSVRTAALSPLAAGSCPYSLVLSSSSVSLVKTVQLCSLRRFHSSTAAPASFHLGLEPRTNHQRFSLNLCCLVPRAPAAPSALARGWANTCFLFTWAKSINSFFSFLCFCFFVFVYVYILFQYFKTFIGRWRRGPTTQFDLSYTAVSWVYLTKTGPLTNAYSCVMSRYTKMHQ